MKEKNKNENDSIDNIETEVNDSTIFVNNPINDENQDVLGIKTYANRINQAIDDGANIIGVIGDYGTGKSSLIELIKKKHNNSININMWGNEKQEKNETTIRSLTKNFLFQMSMGKDETFAKYINKKLSKSYGMLSIILSDKKIIKNLIFPGVLFLIYLLLNSMPSNIYENSMYLNLHPIIDFTNHEGWKNFIMIAYTIIINLKIPVLGLTTLTLVKILLDKSILFSLWDSQGKREPNENDLYDIYIEIANKITEDLSEEEKRIIIVDDLDRANNKKDVKDFIKEIYKFNSVLKDEVKKKIVFIFEVKSEESLENLEIEKNLNYSGGKSEPYKNELYKKVFYFKVNLNTIHYNDYEPILLELLIQKQNEGKRILGKLIKNKLPEEFSYIIKGENLTIRDIKERLNRSFEIYENLIQKSNESSDTIQYQKCALVAYLESKYPIEMLEFIKEEQKFNEILEKAYKYKQENVALKERKSNIKSLIGTFNGNNEFSFEIAEMIANDLIDEDFRLYFYNYPNGQRIKTSDEIYVENIILYPRKIKEIDNEKIKKAIEKDKNIVYKCLERRMNLKLPFDKNIFENEILYKIALRSFYTKVLETLREEVKWKMQNIEDSSEVIRKINNYKVDSEKILKEYALILREDFRQSTKEEIINARKKIIEVTQNKYILCFRDIFINQNIPLITEEELKMIDSIYNKLQLINEKVIDSKNIEYIVKTLNEEKLSENNFNRALEIYKGISNNLKLKTIASNILEFLKKNNRKDDLLFDAISEAFRNDRESVEETQIVNYLNNLNKDEISDEYLKNIELMQLKEQLSNDILNLLKNHEYYETLWINLIKQNRCNELELVNDIEGKLKLVKNIYSIIENDIVRLRKEIIIQELYTQYKSLFLKPYPIISKEEIEILENIQEMKELIDFSNVSENEIEYIVNKINSTSYNSKELIDILEMVDSNVTNSIKDKDLINSFLDKLRINPNNIIELSDEDRTEIYRILRKPLILSNYDNAIKFSRKIGYIIKEIDVLLYDFITGNYEAYISDYIELINELDIPTEQTIKNIIALMSNNKEFELSNEILKELLSKEKYKEYIIGKTIKDDRLILELDKIELENYIEVYNNTKFAYDIMLKSTEFKKQVIDNNLFDKINKEKLEDFYDYTYSIDFVRYLFDTLSKDKVLEYVKNNLKCQKSESYKLRSLICEDTYIWIVESKEMYEIVKNILPDSSDKSQLTRIRNKYFNSKKQNQG